MKKFDKNRLISLIATVLFHAVLLLILVFAELYYSYPPKDQPIEEPKEDEIMFGGEYVMLGNVEQLTVKDTPAKAETNEAIDDPKMPSADLKDAGEASDRPKEMISTQKDSPMKVKKEEDRQKAKSATQSEKAEQDKQKQQQEAERKRINNRVKFGSTTGTGAGTAGSPDGNSSTGARGGKPGIGGLGGYSLEYWGRPSSPVEGTIVISVTVNSRGKVTKAKYVSGTGSAAANTAVRRQCEQESLRSQFSVPKNTTTDAVGTITWRFE